MAKTTSDHYEDTNHLVLSFYPDGYTIAIKLNEFPVFTSETILETGKISYEETSLLDYIENEELPPLLVEMIDASPKLSQYKIWHNGCLILEIRDKFTKKNNNNLNMPDATNIESLRNFDKLLHQEANPEIDLILDVPNTKEQPINQDQNQGLFILLKPTNMSMLNDVQNLTDSDLWSTQERLQLESKIVLHSSPSLSLEPEDTEDDEIKYQKFQKNFWPYKKPINAYTRLKKKLPNSQKYHQNVNNGSTLSRNNNCPMESLPPELTLQQFLTNKRNSTKKFSPGQLPRFHRFSFLRKNNNANKY